jgi:structural maintenance of chromosome 4
MRISLLVHIPCGLELIQDTNAKVTGIHAIKESAEKMNRDKMRVEKFNASLEEKRNVLEGIWDSLKGIMIFNAMVCFLLYGAYTLDKTQAFHDQIEV